MAVTLTLTNEQASWLVQHLEALESDWSWGIHKPSADVREHASSVRKKCQDGQSSSLWEGPGSR